MRFLKSAVLLALLAPSVVPANELLRVYGLARENDTQLRAAVGARDTVLEGVPRARGALLPQITGTAGRGKQETTTTSSAIIPPNTKPTTTVSDDDTDYENLSLRLRQALFDATAWNRWQQADAQAAAAEATYRIAEQGLALRVGEAYFNVLAAADSVRFADAEKKAIERQLELAKRRFEVGLSAITDVQEAQARYDLTVAQLIEAEQGLMSAKLALTEITGAVDTKIVPLREEIPLLGPNPDSVNDWVKAAAEGNFEIRVALAQADAAQQDVDANRAGHYPTLSFVGSRGDNTGSQYAGPLTGNVDTEQESTSVGLELNVPIFAGGSTQAGVNAAQATHQQRLAELEGKRRTVERTTRVAYHGVIAGVSRVKALKQAVLSNTTALEASEVGLEVGARTAVDVLNAQRELYRAQRDYSKSRYDYLLNILRLKIAAGQLSQKDLGEIDGLLGSEVISEVAGS
jgi:outer membrane protein